MNILYTIILCICSSLYIYPQLHLIQEVTNYKIFQGYTNFEDKVNTHLKSVLNDLEVEIDIYYNGEIFKYAQIIINKSRFDYSIIRRVTNDYSIVDLKAYYIISALVESIEIYNHLCPKMIYDAEKIYNNITYINRLKDFKNVWHQLKIFVNKSTGINPIITNVMYDDFTLDCGSVMIDYIVDQPCSFSTNDNRFLNFIIKE